MRSGRHPANRAAVHCALCVFECKLNICVLVLARVCYIITFMPFVSLHL